MTKKPEGISAKLQDILDDLFLPRDISAKVEKIRSQNSVQKSPNRAITSSSLKINSVPAHVKQTCDFRKRKDAKRGATRWDKNGSNNKASGDMSGGRDHETINKDNNAEKSDFTEAQDQALIEHKLQDVAWKVIAADLGKNVAQVKQRFKQIKPADFDARHAEALAAKKEKQQECEKSNTNQIGGERSNDRDEGEKGPHNRTDTNAGQASGCASKKSSKEDAREDAHKDENWWEQPDENWSKEELTALLHISNEELVNAFAQISLRLAKEEGKQVHPASVAEKILGSKPKWA